MTINLADPAFRRSITLGDLPTMLTKIGLDVPDRIVEAQKVNAWQLVADPIADIDDAKRRLREATTEADWLTAQNDLTEASMRGYFRAETAGHVEEIKADRLSDSIRESAGQMFTGILDAYNTLAVGFTDAYLRLPEIALGRVL